MVAQPHFLLFCNTHLTENHQRTAVPQACSRAAAGRWHFVLERLDGPERLEAADCEYSVNRERLALLSVVRGLEALEQPSQVTLVTTSRYVSRGLRYGLNSWRAADYKWERFGEQQPVRNSDLWRRVDTAMQFHGVKCRLIQPVHSDAQVAVQALDPTLQTATPAVVSPADVGDARGLAAAAQPDRFADNRARLFGGSRVTGRSGNLNGQPAVDNPTHGTLAVKSLVLRWFFASLGPAEWQAKWWGLALCWLKWWRGRHRSRPVFYGA